MHEQPDLRGLRLLLVEDEYALAVGQADIALGLGADVLGPVASVADALSLIRRIPEIDAAVLDVNLGADTIDPVADALMARGVPFLFCTARERSALPPRFAHIPLVRKPFGVDAFREALGRFTAAA